MKFIVTTTFALFAIACSSLPTITEQEFLVNHKSVKIDTVEGSGSGFAINEYQVVTAWHVVTSRWSGAPMDPTFIHLHDMDGATPSSIQQLGDLDAALLTFPIPHGLPIWQLDNRQIQEAEPIYISGWGVGVHWWSRGLGTADSDRVSLPVAPGDSGSPVFDARGAVVGILVAKGTQGNHHAFIVPITSWFSLLDPTQEELPTLPATIPPSGRLRPHRVPLDR